MGKASTICGVGIFGSGESVICSGLVKMQTHNVYRGQEICGRRSPQGMMMTSRRIP